MDVKSMVYEYKEELLSRLGKLISINSVEGTPEPDAPFGKGPKVALETALEILVKRISLLQILSKEIPI